MDEEGDGDEVGSVKAPKEGAVDEDEDDEDDDEYDEEDEEEEMVSILKQTNIKSLITIP